jgi:hypothetical protein
VVTGQPYEGRDRLTDCTAALAELHRDLFPPAPTPSAPVSVTPMSIDTDALQQRCEGSPKFRALFAGDLGNDKVWQGLTITAVLAVAGVFWAARQFARSVR